MKQRRIRYHTEPGGEDVNAGDVLVHTHRRTGVQALWEVVAAVEGRTSECDRHMEATGGVCRRWSLTLERRARLPEPTAGGVLHELAWDRRR